MFNTEQRAVIEKFRDIILETAGSDMAVELILDETRSLCSGVVSACFVQEAKREKDIYRNLDEAKEESEKLFVVLAESLTKYIQIKVRK